MVSDETAYRKYLAGDEAAAQLLVERYGDALTLYINGVLGDIHEAEDLMIEAFAYLIAKRPAIRDGGFRAYLERVFDDKVFVVSFTSNVLIAALIVWVGDLIGVGTQLSTAVVVVLGIRIFTNVAAIRRKLFHA